MDWIEEREEELKKLEEDIETLKRKTIGIEQQIANCEKEIGFIEGLQHNGVMLAHKESGKLELEQIKKELQEKKSLLEKDKEELRLEAKIIKRDNLKVYVNLAKIRPSNIKIK